MNQEYQDHLYTVARRWTIAFMIFGIIGFLLNLFYLSRFGLINTLTIGMEFEPVLTTIAILSVILQIAASFYHYRNLQPLKHRETPSALPWYLNFANYLLALSLSVGANLYGSLIGFGLAIAGYWFVKKVIDLKKNQ